jgi:hypothetical protein
MNMHPDNQIKTDMSFLTYLVATILIAVTIYCVPWGMAPADECANDVRNGLSPWRVLIMTKADNLPVSYGHVRQWCESHTEDYHDLMMKTIRTIEEEPRQDMYLDIINRYYE